MSKIKDLYKNDRPREKLINKGASGLKIYHANRVLHDIL